MACSTIENDGVIVQYKEHKNLNLTTKTVCAVSDVIRWSQVSHQTVGNFNFFVIFCLKIKVTLWLPTMLFYTDWGKIMKCATTVYNNAKTRCHHLSFFCIEIDNRREDERTRRCHRVKAVEDELLYFVIIAS